jgi:hypothetical protein
MKNSNKKNGQKLDIHEISLLGVYARGRIPWNPRKYLEDRTVLSEIEVAYRMSIFHEFRFKDGGMKGKPDYHRIAEELNRIYHNNSSIRTRYSVRNALYKYKTKF